MEVIIPKDGLGRREMFRSSNVSTQMSPEEGWDLVVSFKAGEKERRKGVWLTVSMPGHKAGRWNPSLAYIFCSFKPSPGTSGSPNK